MNLFGTGSKINHVFHFPLHQTDPGVPIVYAGFGALMLTTCISYLSHSQVCAYVELFATGLVHNNLITVANFYFSFHGTRYGHCKMEVQ